MDFKDTEEEAVFRKEVLTFLNANAKSKKLTFESSSPEHSENLVKNAKVWQAKKASANFAGITLPKKFGGRGGTAIQQIIYNQEEANFRTPIGVYEIGLGMCIPTILAYASEEQKKRYIPPALCGEEIWCQLFSEPHAGSDLANLSLKSEKSGVQTKPTE